MSDDFDSGRVKSVPESGKAGQVSLSVLMSTYAGDSPDRLHDALESIRSQSRVPDEMRIVVDGPIPEQSEFILHQFATCHNAFPVTTHHLPTNLGLGKALEFGRQQCSGNWIVRMDADDVSLPNRLEALERRIMDDRDLDVITTWVKIDVRGADGEGYIRKTPTQHEAIVRRGRFRYPLNHPACAFRASTLEKAGGYQEFERLEDYHLFARLVLVGARFAAIPEVHYRMNDGEEIVERRHGFARARNQLSLQAYFFKIGYLPWYLVVGNSLLRVVWSVLPSQLALQIRKNLGI